MGKKVNIELLKMENAFGLKGERDVTNYSLAVTLGYKGWNIALNKRINNLIDEGRISVANKRNIGRGQKYTLKIVKPLTGKEKRELDSNDLSNGLDNTSSVVGIAGLSLQGIPKLLSQEKPESLLQGVPADNSFSKEFINDNYNKELAAARNDIENETNNKVIQHESENIDDIDDIDDLFDEFQNISRNLILRTRELQEEVMQLKMKLEVSEEREKRWQYKSMEYKSMLYRR